VKPAALRLALVCYGILFIGIVISADRGASFWNFLNELPMGDKLGHLGLVGTLSLLLNLTLKGKSAPRPFSRLMLGTLVIAAIMTAEELSQAFFPARTLDLLDGLANLTGAALGQWAARFILRPNGRCPAAA
jgi:VanZ family protein